MSELRPDKLHTQFVGVEEKGPLVPRYYPVAHSDRAGQLFLTIAADYNRKQISGPYTRPMRDEVLGEWQLASNEPQLHIHLHASGGLVVGTAAWRDSIFRRHLPMVLEALRYGDRILHQANPHLDQAPIHVDFHSSSAKYDRVENWGRPIDYSSVEMMDTTDLA